ncbi:uncharacterized protein L3040_003013 [Drepanopeziza brunnea f. sp. 'multigermtubi']|uniref:Cutinase n=1 Tax=Marssonina brunnea f. sp. multigermtubi (strain MB_m1) TaxID=1072389 RepID=K1XL88_MARBU|nr:cutinase [Drepanopeziza brunnea f. sp. 'multigermtubi' MB_m1]EKD13209.1 cutinase [Drepanopeziza brunnea f. sp. 'multigermtubi' MB_m1]KAJ5047171.1 hypothetical protein L3040_003013 [Drepanopeziza brunnea f. sp. 'multigermtubi']
MLLLLPSLLALLPLAGVASPLSSVRANKRGTNLSSETQNGLLDGSPCAPITLIWARGTNEIGNVGLRTGPSFFKAVADIIGPKNLAVHGVTYPAGKLGFLSGGSAEGSRNMAELAELAAKQCPETKIVLSGYSQGAQLVHRAAKLLSAATATRISSVVVFGDPYHPAAIPGIPDWKVATFCRKGDNICEGGMRIGQAHREYPQDAPAAAEFVVKQSGL